METGFKRLWLRRKSVGRRREKRDDDSVDDLSRPSGDYDRQTPILAPPLASRFPQASTEQPRKSTSTLKSRHEAYDEARRMSVSDNPPGQPQSAVNNHMVRRPILVGISRPATAGSLQYAVMQAADDAADDDPLPDHMYSTATSHALSRYPSLHPVSAPPLSPLARNPVQPKHVDVLEVTKSRPGTGYNEDVAERNLNMLWLTLNHPKSKYVPGSKYQEEVATRNAAPPAPPAPPAHRPSALPRRASIDTVRSHDSLDAQKVSLTAISAAQFGYTHAPAPEAVMAKARAAQDNATAYHSRQGSGKSWAPTLALPPIPQESMTDEPDTPASLVAGQPISKPVSPLDILAHSQEDPVVSPIHDRDEKVLASDSHPSDLPELDLSRPDSRTDVSLPPDRQDELPGMSSKTPNMIVPDVNALPKPLQTKEMLLEIDASLRALESGLATRKTLAQGGTKANESRPLASQVARGSTRPTGQLTRNSSLPEFAVSDTDVAHHQPRIGQSPSKMESPGPRRILQPQPVRAMSETLLNGHLRDTGSMHTIRAPSSVKKAAKLPRRTVMDLTEEDADTWNDEMPASYPPSEVHTPSVYPAYMLPRGTVTPSGSSMNHAFSHEIDSTTIHEIGDSRIIEPKSKFAFSTVTTLAATTPGSPNATPAPESKSEAHTQNSAAMLDAHSAILSSVPSSGHQHPTNGQQQHTVEELTTNLLGLDASKTSTRSPLSEPHPLQTRRKPGQSKAETPAIIYTSPESLDSTDFVHPQRAFGITARDFALSPSPQPALPPRHANRPNGPSRQQSSDTETISQHNSSKTIPVKQIVSRDTGRTAKDILRTSTPRATDHVQSPPADFFDEDEFARKQEAARAALRRLQQSLEEDDSLPTVKMNYLANRHLIAQLASGPPSRSHLSPALSMHTSASGLSPTLLQQEVPQFHVMNGILVDMPVSTPSGVSNEGHSTSGRQTAGAPQSRAESQAYSFPAHARAHAHASSSTARSPARSRTPLQSTPTSPSGISLSAFPMPQYEPERGRTSRTYSESDRPRGTRMSSRASQASTASVFTIPHKMVPDRLSSLKDRNLVDADKFRLPEPEITISAA